ncbi:MAG: coproporphyrinogen III oxidase, partial [Muribaculaceae bacterium]|nr:coproporphyrinogen III oxidase [Muribaculaceae bacterium]
MTGVYVHVPFCRRRCLYCDFYSVGERLAEWPDYVGALLSEASARIPELPLSVDRDETTLYIGGGTPSLIPSDSFARLASGLL